MHIHILGICGTFMGGIAAIAQESGHKVTGCDQNVYPPMSTQLESLGIKLISGFSADQLNLKPDIFVIGNVVTRGNPLMEEILNQNLPYVSGPQWLSENILNNRWVLAVAGTHGKTTTSSMLAWILEYAGLHPGFLIGGIPENFDTSARIGHVMRSLPPHTREVSPFFVIEADEYDTAFFDKRSKFVHYRPKTVILNNLEFDHADIFENLAAIERQFHHFVRIVPHKGLIISNGNDQNLTHVLAKGCWTPVEQFGIKSGWHAVLFEQNTAEILFMGESQGCLHWQLLGEHNRMNALAALAAARHAGVPVNIGLEALARFKNVKRRMEKRGVVNEVTVYDDFAHHPTAIQTTIGGLRDHIGNRQRIIAVLEPRSNTMKMGIWKEKLADSLNAADCVLCYSVETDWIESALAELGEKAKCFNDLSQLINTISDIVVPGDHVLIMSNGGFGGIHEKLMTAIRNKT
ncbi:MAG TPA: UDP-N-acetylmuramate:L-alanyl-gamma-D-glutamyl-meso-diaminopimelate ligase [Nitrosomonas sp.]|nr:UDP-N-acetylmuramate:L-alanyl-gamma-D-glutamyl-meso-diaminopimelate ligase [Nitrosomonas sp.]